MERTKLDRIHKFERQIGQLPKEVKWCKKCTMSNQRPRIQFDKNGVCSACLNKKYKDTINWDKRKKELIKLLDAHRSDNGSWDVLVPSSGGKDSGYVAHKLKYEYGMNPLLITWSPLLYTNIGMQNYQSLVTQVLLQSNVVRMENLQKTARLSFEEFEMLFMFLYLGKCFIHTYGIKFNIELIFMEKMVKLNMQVIQVLLVNHL